MTPTEKLLAEQEKVVAERGYYSAFTVNGASTALAVAAGKVPVLGEVTITATAVT